MVKGSENEMQGRILRNVGACKAMQQHFTVWNEIDWVLWGRLLYLMFFPF